MIELSDMYARFTRYAWRLETRDHYDVDGDSAACLAAFLRTGEVDRRTPDDNAWMATIAAATERGAYFGRVRLIGRPITDYTKYEMASYPDNVAVGEDVQLVERAWLRNPEQPYPDFWLFDDETVFVQRYDDDGHYLGTELADDVGQYLAIRRNLTTLSVSLAAHLARCGQDFAVVGDTPTTARDGEG